jgi:hypothetical protein
MEKRNNNGASPLLVVFPSPHEENMKESRGDDAVSTVTCGTSIETLEDDNRSLSSRSSSSSGDAIVKRRQLSFSQEAPAYGGLTDRMKDIQARRRQLESLVGSEKERRDDETTSHNRRTKLNELRASRSERESQLRDLLDHQQTTQPRVIEPVVYDDLRDELLAAYEVIHQQRSHLNEQLESSRRVLPSVKPSEDNKDVILQLEGRLSRLEIDRAWGEFQLRNRISSDAMAYQESIRHWKKEATSWQNRFEESWEDHQSQIEYWKGQTELWKGRAKTAEQEFSSSQKGSDSLVLELLKVQETVAQLEGSNHDDVSFQSSQEPPDHQSSFLLEAMQRKPQTTNRPSLKSRIKTRMKSRNGDVLLSVTSSSEM